MEMSWHPREHEAQMLAGLLRSARLTLLTGVAGAGKTCLLREGVLPRLARRADDLPGVPAAALWADDAADRARPVAPADAMERRQRGGDCGEPGGREVAVYLDAWQDEAPLDALRCRLYAAFGRTCPQPPDPNGMPPLRHLIDTLCREHDARLLVVLDAFEDCLKRPASDPAAAEFASEWAQAVNQPGLPAHFLVAVRQEAQALMARFHRELPALASNWIGLAPVPGASQAPDSPDSPDSPESPDAPDAPVTVLTAPAPGRGPAVDPIPSPPQARPCASSPVRRGFWAALLGLGLVGAGLAIWTLPVRPPSRPQPAMTAPDSESRAAAEQAATPAVRPGPAAATARAPAPAPEVTVPAALPSAPPASAAPGWRIQTGPGQRTDAQVARELQQALEARRPAADWPALQIVHYDALEVARTQADPALRVIGPLYPQELQLVVRADSTLRFIHEIRGRRIVTLPAAEGGPSGTAALLHQRLFGQLPTAGQIQAAAWPQALADLQSGRTDVLLLADGEPSAWWSELSAQERSGLRLLSLDPAAPPTRQVLQTFLPVRMSLPEGLGGPGGPATQAGRTMPTLAVMSFLTTTAPPSSDAALLGLVRAWCQALPELRRNGHPKWRAAQPWLPLGVGGPPVPGVREALSRCAPRPPTSPSPSARMTPD